MFLSRHRRSCSHQMVALEGLLVRGDDACRLTLVSLTKSVNKTTSPLHLDLLLVDIQFSKTNRGDKIDQRALTYHKVVHRDGLFHLGLHFYSKLASNLHGQPIQWSSIENGEWCDRHR